VASAQAAERAKKAKNAISQVLSGPGAGYGFHAARRGRGGRGSFCDDSGTRR
jgi:hypothetical protein